MRKEEFTRTITSKEVECLMLNTETAEPHIEVFIVTSKISDDKMLSFLRDNYETETERICDVVAMTVISERYALSLEDFMKYAHKVEKADTAEVEAENTDSTITE